MPPAVQVVFFSGMVAGNLRRCIVIDTSFFVSTWPELVAPALGNFYVFCI